MNKNKYVYLKNYTPPNFLIENIVLDFNLDRKKTILKSEFSFCVNRSNLRKSDLVLDGEKINLKSLKLFIMPVTPMLLERIEFTVMTLMSQKSFVKQMEILME